MTAPWSQSLILRWTPNLTFFERRIEILRLLEAQDRLSAFKVADGAIQADVAPDLAIELTAVGCTTHAINPQGAQDVDVIALVLSELSPRDIDVHCTLQYVAPVDAEYNDARLRLSSWVTRDLLAPSALAIDSAPLIDGISEDLKSGFQVEFGVIDSSEALPRLTRRVGRLNQADDAWFRLVSRSPEEARTFPQSAVFAEWRWTAAADLDWVTPTGIFVDSLQRWSVGLRTESSDLVRRVQSLVQSADTLINDNSEHEAV